jgi:hypothetical protein
VPADWEQVNGVIPPDLPPGASMQSYLERVSLERGMHAEMDFRANHFGSMRDWPDRDPRIRLFRYEDVLGREVEVFREIFDFFELPAVGRARGLLYAKRHAAGRRAADRTHIRNARSGQWRSVLPASVVARMNEEYGDVLDRHGYARG